VQEGGIQANDTRYYGKIVSEYETSFTITTVPVKDGPFCRNGRCAIVPVHAPYNWDAASGADSSSEILKSRWVVINGVFNLPDLDDPVSIADSEASIDCSKILSAQTVIRQEPICFILLLLTMITAAAANWSS
jgi:hypothetical protein